MKYPDDDAQQAHRQTMKALMQSEGWQGMGFRAAQQNAYAKMRMATADDVTVKQLVELITDASYSESSPADYIDTVQYQYVDLLMMGVAPADLLAAEGGLVDNDFIEVFRAGLLGRISASDLMP